MKNRIHWKWKVFIMAASLVLGSESLHSQTKAPKTTKGDSELFELSSKNPKLLKNIFPSKVRTIAFIAPGSYPGSSLHKEGIEQLRKAGYNIKIMPNAFVRTDERAQAPLEGRVSDFCQAWNDPEVDMIICIRGGLGSEQVIDSVDWSKLKKRPELYFQGYSDITMITCALFNKGYGHPVAGPNSGSIAGMTEDSIEAMRSVYSGTQLGPIQLESLNPGDCSGKPLPGLLHRLEILSRKPYCPSAEGRIVFIEAVGTTAEMIEENLDALLKRNFLKGATGVVFCQFVRCRDNEKIDLILKKFASKLKIPVYKGFPFGHTSRIYCLDFARQAEIKDNAIIFPAVSAASKKK